MDSKQLLHLEKQFRFGGQGYIIIKYLFMLYCFRKAGIKSPSFSDLDSAKERGGDNRLRAILKFANSNIDTLSHKLTPAEFDILALCIKSFDTFYVAGSGMTTALQIAESMSDEEIAHFIVNCSASYGERDDLGTPFSVSMAVIGLLMMDHKKGPVSWFDLACGNGDFLTQVARMEQLGTRYSGMDLVFNSTLLTQMRLYFVGAKDYRIYQDNVLTNPPYGQYDYSFVDMPHGVPYKYNDTKTFAVLKSAPASNKTDWIFVDRLASSLKEDGRGVAIILDSCLCNCIDSKERKVFVDANIIEGVIRLPNSIFPYFDVPVSLLILCKNKKNSSIKFLDASHMSMVRRRFAEADFEQIVYNYYNPEGPAIEVPYEEIVKNDYSLNCRFYTYSNNISFKETNYLENVVDQIFRGAQISASEVDKMSSENNEGDSYYLVSVGDLQDGSFEIDKLQKIKCFNKFDRYLVHKGDILLSGKSTKIKTAIVDDIGDAKIIANGSIIVIRCEQSKVNPVYLKTFFDSSLGRRQLETIQTGTAIISINVPALYDLKYPNLSRKKQDAIAEAFMTNLVKLKLAKLKVKQLEQQMESLFDEHIED